jgi:sarcosine oxidase/L-pipecolate oxidase
MQEWQTPVFARHFHLCGYLLATSAAAPQRAKATLQRSLSSISSHPKFRGNIVPINDRGSISSLVPAYTGPMSWTGYFNRLAGYAHAKNAMQSVYWACLSMGVMFHTGDEVTELLYEGNHTAVGAVTASGQRYRAERTIVCLGANVVSMLPQLRAQITARAWTVAHIQLTPEESECLRGIPVTYARDLGFFFEPDRETNLWKLCAAGAGYTNRSRSSDVSTPNYHIPGTSLSLAELPPQDERLLRQLIRETFPHFADRPFVDQRLCWCADTDDSNWIIDFPPDTKGLLVVTGDSGHSFKMLPLIGKIVRRTMEEGRQREKRWLWREAKQDKDAVVSWRVGAAADLKDVFPAKL